MNGPSFRRPSRRRNTQKRDQLYLHDYTRNNGNDENFNLKAIYFLIRVSIPTNEILLCPHYARACLNHE